MIPAFIIVTIFCLIGSFGVFEELIPLGALSSKNEARLLSVIFFNMPSPPTGWRWAWS